MTITVTVLGNQAHSRYLNRDGGVRCVTCGKELKIGDKIVSKKAIRSRRRLRHEVCAKKVGLI